MTAPTDPMREPAALRLKAAEPADLEVIAAMLQDALLPVMDIAFQPAENRFLAVANRYRWENAESPERVLCGLRVEQARAVRVKGFLRSDRGKILNLLSIALEEAADGRHLRLIFAGGAEIDIAVDALAVMIEDYGEPWPALSTPRHDEGGSP